MSSTIAHPGPLAERDHDPAPWRGRDGIIKFLEFPVRKAGLSHRAFHLYWQRHHSPHVMNVTGFSRYMRKYVSAHGYDAPVSGLPARYRQTMPFDGASEVWVNGLDEIAGWLGHPLYPELIHPDEQRFLSQEGLTRTLLTREERILEGPPDAPESGLVKLYTLLKAREGLDRESFHAGVSAHAHRLAQLGGPPAPCQLAVSHRIADPLPIELQPSGIDAVLELVFASLSELRAYLVSSGDEAAWAAAEDKLIDAGASRALVARLCVVHDEFSFQPTTMQPRPFSWDD
jgi:hypothetical protein